MRLRLSDEHAAMAQQLNDCLRAAYHTFNRMTSATGTEAGEAAAEISSYNAALLELADTVCAECGIVPDDQPKVAQIRYRHIRGIPEEVRGSHDGKWYLVWNEVK